MRKKLISMLLGLSFLAGCVIAPDPMPESVVYYGSYGDYYGPYYYGPSGVIIIGAPLGWHGHYYHGPSRGYYHGYSGHRR